MTDEIIINRAVFDSDKYEEKFNKLGKHEITLLQREDKYKHWRLGLDWRSEDTYLFICEKPTIMECLDCAIEFLENR